MSGRVRSTAKDSLIYYGNQGIGTSSESRRLGLPNVRVKDSPDCGFQESQSPVRSDDNMPFGSGKSWGVNQPACASKNEARLPGSRSIKPTRIMTSAARCLKV